MRLKLRFPCKSACFQQRDSRDGTGLLSVNDYPNSQDFNAISEALNRIIESRCNRRCATAKVGVTLRFAGCVEVVNDEATDLKPLKRIPIAATVE